MTCATLTALVFIPRPPFPFWLVIVAVATAVVITFALLAVTTATETGFLSRLLARKIIHAFNFSLAAAIAPFFGFWGLMAFGAGASIAAFSLLGQLRRVRAALRKGNDTDPWTSFLIHYLATGLGCTATAILFEPACALGLWITAFADPAAALVGSKYGRREYYIGKDRRTYLGSITTFVTAALVTTLWALSTGSMPLPLLAIAATALVAALAEGLSPSMLDNGTVPLVSTAVWWWLAGSV